MSRKIREIIHQLSSNNYLLLDDDKQTIMRLMDFIKSSLCWRSIWIVVVRKRVKVLKERDQVIKMLKIVMTPNWLSMMAITKYNIVNKRKEVNTYWTLHRWVENTSKRYRHHSNKIATNNIKNKNTIYSNPNNQADPNS